MTRIFLFMATNIAVIALISIVFQILGIEGLLAENGVDEWEFPLYTFKKRKDSRVTHKIKEPVVEVHALGDYTKEEWKSKLFERLRETSPAYAKAAYDRVRRKVRARERYEAKENNK